MRTMEEFEKTLADIMKHARLRVRAAERRAQAQMSANAFTNAFLGPTPVVQEPTARMRLYRLTRTDRVRHDEASALLVRAENAAAARLTAACSRTNADEGPSIWEAASTQVERVRVRGKSEVIFVDTLEG